MTQDVQPLTWSRRTNLEEHQQFFSKINEIIANLAPTVDEAEAAIAQATQAITNANAAIATANAASAAADAAAQQAQAAAATVAGYDTRLTAAEGDIDALHVADQTITGNVAALGTRVTAVESKNTQQDTAIAALQTADGQNVKISRINEYAVGLTGNQNNIAGIKKFTGANVKIQGGITFNDPDVNNDTVRGSVFSTTPTMYFRSYSQLKNNEFSELRLSCNRTETQITFGLYLLSYQNVDGTATLKDYHPIYEKVVEL